jgi:maltose-binding protein MalE
MRILGRARACAACFVLVVTAGSVACQPRGEKQAHLTVGTAWSGPAAEALHRELLRVAERLGSVTIDVRTYNSYGLYDYLSKNQPQGGEGLLDLVVVPNDWLGQLAERGTIGELPSTRVEAMQDRLVRQAVLAVTDRDKVLAFPVSAETLALIYDPQRFPSPPGSIDEILSVPMQPGTIPIAVNLASPYHLAPLVSAYQGNLVDVDGNLIWRDDILLKVFLRTAPAWQAPGGWRCFTGEDLESLQLQLFSDGILASFISGPWLLEALEACGRPFAVTPVPAFADAEHPARALVGYQCVAVAKDSPWADLGLQIGASLLEPDANERLNRSTRRLSVLIDSFQSQRAMASQGTVGFLRALEQGQFFPAAAHWSDSFQRAGDRLQRVARRPHAPTRAELPRLVSGGLP